MQALPKHCLQYGTISASAAIFLRRRSAALAVAVTWQDSVAAISRCLSSTPSPGLPISSAHLLQVEDGLRKMLRVFDAALCRGRTCSSDAGSFVELGEDEGIGNLPLVNGVLLGYPFVYYVTAENVNRATAWLSASQLRLFRCCLLLSAFFGGCFGVTADCDRMSCGCRQKATPSRRCVRSGRVQSEAEVVLWTCSAPMQAVCPDGEAVDIIATWRSWCQHHGTSAAAGTDVWASSRFDEMCAGQQAVVVL